MARRWKKMAILAKVETTVGTDAVPTGAANAIQALDVTLTPLAGDEIQRDYMVPYLGNQGALLVGNYNELQFSVELSGSGTLGTPPALAPLLKACAFAEVITAGASVAYNPISSGFQAVSIYANLDGVNHVLLGARGTCTLNLAPKQIPRLQFNFKGLLGPIADVALPSVTLTSWLPAVPVSKANTPVWTLHGHSAIAESLSIDVGNTVTVRSLVNYEGIEITDRSATGSMVIEAVAIGTKDWFSLARAGTTGALAITHGMVAGNIVDIAAPAVQIGRPTYGQTDAIINNTLPLMLRPASGNDELTLTFR
ncbi:phage tail tube protein [Segnochrobactrum spirostomi]|uniref:Uncharacterized protein n=1 Tax=Segnochrobactrum spirostomi TaxID=2608987 RepID=A0A6A7Y6D1_9HYPH|nr:phage tail tube protein [Segnochrobactrum spirostomi]MQT13641.1 hypothetical protein [Segnochrobactrum spirostomi]